MVIGVAVAIARSIVRAPDSCSAVQAAARTALQLLRGAHRDGALKIVPREIPWLDRMENALDSLPASEAEFVGEMMGRVDTTKFVAADYELG